MSLPQLFTKYEATSRDGPCSHSPSREPQPSRTRRSGWGPRMGGGSTWWPRMLSRGSSSSGHTRWVTVTLHNIWWHVIILLKVEEVLAKDSTKVLEDGDNPGPLEEIQFWESKRVNLESLFEQMKAKTTRHMASILNVTDSAYYPCFK